MKEHCQHLNKVVEISKNSGNVKFPEKLGKLRFDSPLSLGRVIACTY